MSRAVGLDLPVGAHLDEVRVDREELVVGGADDILRARGLPLDGEERLMGLAPIRRQGPSRGAALLVDEVSDLDGGLQQFVDSRSDGSVHCLG